MKRKLGPKTMIFPMPALLVGTYSEDGAPNAMTAAWASVCCHRPPCVSVAVRHNRATFANLQKKKAFSLNVPKSSQATAVDYLGMVSGNDEPKKLEVFPAGDHRFSDPVDRARAVDLTTEWLLKGLQG